MLTGVGTYNKRTKVQIILNVMAYDIVKGSYLVETG